jgi:endonuclease YncB( thermonuclease family)
MEDELRNALDGTTEEFSLEGKVLRAKVVSLYDADTCRVVFHQNNTLVKYTVRMVGIDTPEMRPSRSNPDRLKEKRAAKIARNRMAQFLTNAPIELMGSYTKSQFQDLIDKNTRIIDLHAKEFDKYGRLLALLYDSENDSKSANERLVEEGYALSYDGGTKGSFNWEQYPNLGNTTNESSDED